MPSSQVVGGMKTKAIEIIWGKNGVDFEGTSESASSLYADPGSGHTRWKPPENRVWTVKECSSEGMGF